MKNENTIWSNVIDAVEAGLAENSIADFEVIQSGQPSKSTIPGGTASPTIWIDKVSSKRYGKQSRTPSVEDDVLIENKSSYQEIMFQVTGRKSRLPADTISTQTSTDVLNLLVDYFNGQEGIDKLKTFEMSCINVTEVRTPVGMSDSDLYSKDPSFDLTITLIQSNTRTLPVVTEKTVTIEQV